ncbi:unnamed protein product [Bursaphelenchus xylophilus]|uniref:(pine wood nematode) hypothetical protein n=1 Tax=Bursaphelenchus xylophilus TaxID=6326 RepID=A0A1I7RT54_BURXY|nr:unnamed protein product [Bursaphelenchus xylophilus]CAG9122602.1 unnamed protein product [Bursaphelenchus xylophilus]
MRDGIVIAGGEMRLWMLSLSITLSMFCWLNVGVAAAEDQALPNLDTLYRMSQQSRGVGLLKMCPPGGEAFTNAWQMTCGMRRRKRSTLPNEDDKSRAKRDYRPLSLTEMMQFCCQFSCSFRDLMPYCDPFGQWDS